MMANDHLNMASAVWVEHAAGLDDALSLNNQPDFPNRYLVLSKHEQ
jgi:hypothetical protein